MNKNIYIRDEDAPLWKRVRELTGTKSISPIVTESLRKFIKEMEAKEAETKGYQRIVVKYNDSDANWVPRIKAFHGKWIYPIEDPVTKFDDDGKKYCYAVAVTAKNACVVYRWEEDQQGRGGYRFLTFPSLEAAAANDDVNYAAREAIEKMGVPVEELDI